MNTKQLFAATAFAIVGTTTAFAQSSHEVTRSEVRAEYIRARQAGEIPLGTEFTIADTRASVVSRPTRTKAATNPTQIGASSQIVAAGGSFNDAPVSVSSPKTRAEVRAEAVAYTHDRQASNSQLADH